MSTANPQRGEVTIKGPENKDFKLCLTLGAIAKLEKDLGIESLSEIDKVMGKGSMGDLIKIVKVLLEGGANPVTDEQMMIWPVNFKELMEKIRECFAAAGFEPDGEDAADDAPAEEGDSGNG